MISVANITNSQIAFWALAPTPAKREADGDPEEAILDAPDVQYCPFIQQLCQALVIPIVILREVTSVVFRTWRSGLS
jgi:hypothetical protein